MNVRIVHLSDVHFGIENKAATEAAIAAAHGQCPDVVIVTGDMTLGGEIREFEAARNWLSRLPRPLLVTPGNHDTPYWNLPLRAFAPFARYRRYIDPLSEPAIDLPRIVARTINTARGMQPRLDWSKGAVNLRAIQQAAEQMSEVPAALRILVCHHPLVEPEAVAVTGAVHRGEAAALMLAEAGVDLILSGHVHNPFAVALAGRNDLTYTVGAGTLSLRTRGSPESFSVIEADENDIKISALAWSGKTFEPFLSWLLPRRRS